MFFSIFNVADGASGSQNPLLDFFTSLVSNIDYSTLLYVFAGIMLGVIVISAISLLWSYEERCIRNIRKINSYLSKHPSVNDNNIVAFNTQMKKLPRRVRDRWQLYMLERDGSPSRYLNIEYCVKRPLNNSAFMQMRNQMKCISLVLAAVSLLFSLMVAIVNPATATSSLISVFASCAITPCVVLATGYLYVMILQLRYKYLNTDFYDIFTNFARNIDKASTTLPDYVDYELLFTRKEIDAGIPVLREYLEKKALEEQRLLEKAKRAEVEHSPYDFDELGVNGQLLIERAVNESENFLLEKIDIQNEINRLEKQKDNTTKNMEDIEREANKRLQAINENLDRLDKELSEKTNKVEINFTMGQIKQERDKKATLEKDLATRLEKEKTAQDALNVEIQKRKEKINEGKHDVEVALKAEYNTFAGRLYDEIYQKVVNTCAEDIHKYQIQIDRLKNKLLEFDKELDVRDTAIKTKDIEIENLKLELSKHGNDKAVKGKKSKHNDVEYSIEPNGEYTNTVNNTASDEQNLMTTTSGVADGDLVSDYSQYYDESGNAIDYSNNDKEQVDESMFYDENGNLIDYSQYYDEFGNLKPEYSSDESTEELEQQGDDNFASGDEQSQQNEEIKDVYNEEQPNNSITTDDLLDLQKQIAEENIKLNQQREELRNQIDQTLNSIDKKPKKAAKTPAKKKETKSKAASAKPAAKTTTKVAPKKATAKKEQSKKIVAKKAETQKEPAKKVAGKKPVAKKEPVKKAEPKKPAAKKTTPKKAEAKPAAKKTAAKKPTKKDDKSKDIIALTRQIENLKQEVKTAKARGASEEEVKAINTKIADILKDLANVKK